MTGRVRTAALVLAALLVGAAACAPTPERSEPACPAATTDDEIDRLARRLAGKLSKLDLEAVVVLDFHDLRGDTSELGRHLAQEVASALVEVCERPGCGAPRVIDRHRMAEIVAGRAREAQGLIPHDELRRGAIGGADALVTGKLVSFSDSIRLSVQVIDFRDVSAVLAMEAAYLPRSARLSELEGRTLRVRRAEDIDVTELWTARPPLQSWPARRPESFRVDLQGCGRLEESVYCLFAIQAVGQDRSVSVLGTSRAVLPDGSQVAAAQVQVGASTSTGPSIRAGDRLVEGIPTAAALRFDDVPPDVHHILRLTLALQGEDAEFEQVPIERL
jgi:hypothetical protein